MSYNKSDIFNRLGVLVHWHDLPPFSGPLEVRVKAVVWPCAAEGEA